MNVIDKEFKEVSTGEIYRVIDVYQNLAVAKLRGTNTTERIVVTRLIDPKFYLPLDGNFVKSTVPVDESKKFTIHTDDYVDPNKFFNESNTLALFADQIKSIPEDRLPREDLDIPVTTSHISNGMMPSTNESAIIIDNDYDEAEEIAKKYGVSNVDNSIRAQNEKFAKLLDPEDLPIQNNRETKVDVVDVYNHPIQEPVQHIKVEDPITTMFRNVKRTINFNLDLKIENKIPRIDFIEMMEDSYQTSIIEFLAEEFTEELLKNPNGLKKMISDKIRSLVYDGKKSDPVVSKVVKKKTTIKKKSAPKKDKINDTGTLS